MISRSLTKQFSKTGDVGFERKRIDKTEGSDVENRNREFAWKRSMTVVIRGQKSSKVSAEVIKILKASLLQT